MKVRKKLTSIALGCALSLASYGQVYMWLTVDPYVPFNSMEYYQDASGFPKKVRQKIIQLNRDVYSDVSAQMDLQLRKMYVSACNGVSFINTMAPLQDMGEETSLFVDFSCGLTLKQNDYPYYRKGNLNLSPEIFYRIRIFNGAGLLMDDKTFLEKIDYREQIRPEIQDAGKYYLDAEIFRYGLIASFGGEGLKKSLDYICEFYGGIEESEFELDHEQFKNSISVLADQRKLEYPGYFDEFSLDYSSVSHGSSYQVNNASSSGTPADGLSQQQPPVDPEMVAAFKAVRERSKNYALLIGISQYRSEEINDLPKPVQDARNLAQILLERYDFYPEELVLLENPTREGIMATLDKLANTVREQDNLLIFYAGHGHWDETLEKGYWIPSDASTNNRANWFSNSDLRDYISGIKTHHTLLITDACFSGGIFKTREAFNEISPATFELYKYPSRKAMTSGNMTTVPDESVFIKYLLERLKKNTSTYLSSEQLFASFKIAVINNSTTRQVPLYGEIYDAGDEGGDFLFILK